VKNKTKYFFALLASLILLFTVSFSTLSLIEFSQVKKEYQSLYFIPADAELLIRIDAKQIGKDLIQRVIKSGKTAFFKKEKINLNPNSTVNYSSVDWDFPVYTFPVKTTKDWAIVTVFSLASNGFFVNKNNEVPLQNAFEFQQKGFLVSGCDKESFLLVKKNIETQNSSGWNKLLAKKESISFQSKTLDLFGVARLQNNDFIIESELNYIQSPVQTRKFLKPEGFHVSMMVPTNGIDLLTEQVKKYVDIGWKNQPVIESASINYLGLKPPYFPQFQLLLNTAEPFAINEFIERNDLSIVKGDESEIKLGELTLNGREIDDYSYLLTTVPTKKINYYTTQNLGGIEGDLNKLIQLDNAPMLRMFLLFNSNMAAATQFIEKTKRISLVATPNSATKKQRMVFKIEMKPSYNFLDEIIQLVNVIAT
jgi:hypothetical protein